MRLGPRINRINCITSLRPNDDLSLLSTRGFWKTSLAAAAIAYDWPAAGCDEHIPLRVVLLVAVIRTSRSVVIIHSEGGLSSGLAPAETIEGVGEKDRPFACVVRQSQPRIWRTPSRTETRSIPGFYSLPLSDRFNSLHVASPARRTPVPSLEAGDLR